MAVVTTARVVSPGVVGDLVYDEPANGITDSDHHAFLAEGAVQVSEPTEANESDSIG